MPKKDRSKNALKHGAFSRELILPGESRKEYERLLSELEAEYSPSGPSETYLVNQSCLAPLAGKTPAGLSAGHAGATRQDDREQQRGTP